MQQTKKTSHLFSSELKCVNRQAAFLRVKVESRKCPTKQRCNLKLSLKDLMTPFILANPESIKAKISNPLIWEGHSVKYFPKKTKASPLLK